MRILLVQDSEWRKKGPHHQHHLMELLSLRGHKIMVIGFDQLWKNESGGLVSCKEIAYNVSRFYKGSDITFIRPFFIRLPLLDYISFFFSSRKEINLQIKKFNPDVVIGFSSLLSNYWGMIYAKKNKIPFLYYYYDIIHDLNVPKQFRLIAILLEKIIISKSTAILVINEALKDYLVDFGANPSNVTVISGGIDQNMFNPERIDRKSIRNKYGFRDQDLVLFFMGWIYEFSGLDQIVIELYKLGESASKIKLLIVGDGDHYHELKALVEEYSLGDRVILTGKMPYNDIPKLIATSDICLLPAIDNEVMKYIVPIKMYEYLAMLKPVISTELQGVVKEFGHSSGVLYIKRPEEAINKALGLTVEDIASYGDKAHQFIKSYKWNRILNDFEIYLNELIILNHNK